MTKMFLKITKSDRPILVWVGSIHMSSTTFQVDWPTYEAVRVDSGDTKIMGPRICLSTIKVIFNTKRNPKLYVSKKEHYL